MNELREYISLNMPVRGSEEWDKISQHLPTNAIIRNGGTFRQRVDLDNRYSSSELQEMVSLQNAKNFKFIYVLNLNNVPSDEFDDIERLINAGLRIELIQIGNENWLTKYNGDPDGECVTERTARFTIERYYEYAYEYIQEAVSRNIGDFTWIFNLATPSIRHDTNRKRRLLEYNRQMYLGMDQFQAVISDIDWMFSMHVYSFGGPVDTSLFYDQMDEFGYTGHPVIVTESGVPTQLVAQGEITPQEWITLQKSTMEYIANNMRVGVDIFGTGPLWQSDGLGVITSQGKGEVYDTVIDIQNTLSDCACDVEYVGSYLFNKLHLYRILNAGVSTGVKSIWRPSGVPTIQEAKDKFCDCSK